MRVLLSERMGKLLKFEITLHRRAVQHWREKYGRLIAESRLREQQRIDAQSPKFSEASPDAPSSK